MSADLRTVISSSPSFGRYSQEPVALLRDAGCEVHLLERGDTRALLAALPGADAWIAGFEPVDATTLSGATRLKVVAKCGAGMDNFDLDYLAGRGIATVNVPGGNAGAVAEYTIAQVLSLARGLGPSDAATRAGRWSPTIGMGLQGRTLGVVGLGAIGREVARLATAFGMSVVVADPVADAGTVRAAGGELVGLPELLRRSDVVTLHVPLNEDTRHLIGAAELAAMPDHALLVNDSRGGVVDEQAVAAALHAGTLGGAALDVFEREPLAADDPLLTAPRLLLSPHTAGYSDAALAVVTHRCAESLLAALDA